MNDHQDPSARDHESDPAHTPGNGWVDEGGASHLGPATHLRGDAEAHEHTDDEAEEEAN